MEYDITDVDGIVELHERIRSADSIEDWSHILSDYISFGNNKIHKSVGIFNFNSATDCPNAKTAKCQVEFSECYAHKAEKQYGTPLDYRRRQEYLRDCLDPDTFAKAFLELVSRKRNEVSALRFSEAGDFRHRGDIIWADRVAELIGQEGIKCYTYSASSDLEWSEAEHFTVNASNDLSDYGDRRYMAFTSEEPPDGFVWCPHDKQKQDGVDPEDAIKCGTCRLCLDKEGPDVAIPLH
jgi:hypothetical protein